MRNIIFLMRNIIFLLTMLILVGLYFYMNKQKPFIVLASTTSTEDSGLLKAIIPQFKAKTGVDVRVVAVGTGQAFEIAKRGDADLLLVHDRKGEDAFMASGKGLQRQDVMYNDFVLVGHSPLKAKNMKEALVEIIETKSAFISRGDDSGTDRKEKSLWGQNPKSNSNYKEVGAGMGAALNIAAQSNAYILTDRATWASFKNKGNMRIILEGYKALLNPYGSIVVTEKGRIFHDWLTSNAGRAAIAAFKVNGEQLFFIAP